MELTLRDCRRALRICGSLLFALALLPLAPIAHAGYGKTPEDQHVDPEVVRVDEDKYLGTGVSEDYALTDAAGEKFRLGELFGRPLVLVLSYYSCDGACPTINRNLRELVEGVDSWKLGEDFRVLTVSFDPHDTPASLKMFTKHVGFESGTPDGWHMALLDDPADIERLTGSVGFKYFWSPRDRMFLHPNVYMMVSPQGRIVRYLYGTSVESQDLEISITKAQGNEISPANVVNFVLGACYSYNYEDGKYTINYPLFIAGGGLVLGSGLLIGASIVIKKRKRVSL